MEKKKKILIAALIPLGIIAGIIMISLHRKPDLEELSNNFIINLAEKNYEKAYSLTSEGFRKNVTLEKFPETIAKSSFARLNGINWLKQDIDSSTGTLEGEGSLKEGGILPVIFVFRKDMYSWKLHEIRGN